MRDVILRMLTSMAVASLSCAGDLLFAGDTSALTAQAVVQDWRGLQRRFETVRFRFSGTVETCAGGGVPPDPFAGPSAKNAWPPEPQLGEYEGDLLLDLAGKRARREKRDFQQCRNAKMEWVWGRVHEIAMFNGEFFQRYYPPEDNHRFGDAEMDRLIDDLDIRHDCPATFLFVEHKPLLMACGVFDISRDVTPDRLKVALDAALLRVEDAVMHHGRRHLVLRTMPTARRKSTIEFTVDAADPRRISRYVGIREEGETWITISIDYQDTEWGPIPGEWVVNWYSYGDGLPPTRVYRFHLDDFEANPLVSDADFEMLNPPPGTRVDDNRRPRGDQKYVIGEPGTPNLPVGEYMLQQEEARSRRWLYVGLAAVVAVLITGTVMIRRRREA